MRIAIYEIIGIGMATAVSLSACSRWEPDVCPSGRRCPPGAYCAANQDICITTSCGNGLIDTGEGEVCDHGNVLPGDGCSADCLSNETCGNGIVDSPVGEECDASGESTFCDEDCTTASCGDGTTNATAGEICDDAGDSLVCDSDCTPATCGDGYANEIAGEECDASGESTQCDQDCTFATCGDGTTNTTAGEACDDAGNSPVCNANCTLSRCLDGFPNPVAGEECDDGVESALCDTDCTLAVCGDMTLNIASGEQCDDGGDTAACDSDCSLAICPDGYLNTAAGEECDDDNGVNTDGCVANCRIARCGDGYHWGGVEQCDDGKPGDGGNGCDGNCQYTSGRTCETSDLRAPGDPHTEPGMRIAMQAFTLFGTATEQILIEYPTGPGLVHFIAFPLVFLNDRNGGDDETWNITATPVANGYRFDLVMADTGTSGVISGVLVVMGFDTNRSDALCGVGSHSGGATSSLAPTNRTSQSKVKVLPFAYTHAYLPAGDDDLAWAVSHTLSASPTCDAGFTSGMQFGNADSNILWRDCLLLLAETVRIEEWSFSVSSGTGLSHIFSIDPAVDQVVLPIINNYYTAGDDDLAYSLDCLTGSDYLECSAYAWDGDTGVSSIGGRVILLEGAALFTSPP